MKWEIINTNRNRDEIVSQLRKQINESNYGFEPENWNLSDVIREASPLKAVALQILNGEGADGKKDDLSERMRMPDGTGEWRYRLRVLTRQACAKTADGKRINGWSAGNRCKGDQTPENTVFPEHNEPPAQGDVVLVKRGHKPRLLPQQRDAMLARGDSHVLYEPKTVDAHGCIWCTMAEAAQLLLGNGKRLVFPEFRRPDRLLEDAHAKGQGARPRRITQWHFEEVPHNYESPRGPGRPRKTADSAEA